MSEDVRIRRERTHNLWESARRKFRPLDKASELEVAPEVGTEQIGGLAQAQEEVLTYACAMTNPEVYAHWGTFPPSGVLLLGQPGCGKTLLARAMATRAETPFLRIALPRFALEVVHHGGRVGDLLEAWSQALSEMPPITVFFHELEFSQTQELGSRRPDLPIGPLMDFLLDFVDRATALDHTLCVASTSHPDSLRPAFIQSGRFERMVEVMPSYPDDIVAALRIHAAAAEKRAGRTLFEEIDWPRVVRGHRDPATADWIRLMHAVLRRKARREASEAEVAPVSTEDLVEEVDRFRRARVRLPYSSAHGSYV